jgi:hypothetical protein
MTCYSYKILKTTTTPILKNVDVVLILTMEGSNRFKEDPFLLNLTKKTIIQYNKGFRKCNKPSTIISSREDIVHAYYTAFEYLKEYNNVIILEDDALVINKNPLIYNKIDKFINTQDFDIFTFGSFGLFSNYNRDFLKINLFFGALQAVIYSKKARNKLTKDIILSNFNKGDMDLVYVKRLDKIFTYKYPLIVQLFPRTENQNSWFGNVFIIYIVTVLIKLLRLDTSVESWVFLYFIFRNYKIILLIIGITFYFIAGDYFKSSLTRLRKIICY